MADKPEALRLADWFEGGYGGCELEAAAELRRLHDEVQMLDVAYRIACKIIKEQDRKLAKVEAVNAELLEALKFYAAMMGRKSDGEPFYMHALDLDCGDRARAAVAKVEEQK